MYIAASTVTALSTTSATNVARREPVNATAANATGRASTMSTDGPSLSSSEMCDDVHTFAPPSDAVQLDWLPMGSHANNAAMTTATTTKATAQRRLTATTVRSSFV